MAPSLYIITTPSVAHKLVHNVAYSKLHNELLQLFSQSRIYDLNAAYSSM